MIEQGVLCLFLSFFRTFVLSFLLSILLLFFCSFFQLYFILSFNCTFVLSFFLSIVVSFFLSIVVSFFLSIVFSFFLSFFLSIFISFFLSIGFPLFYKSMLRSTCFLKVKFQVKFNLWIKSFRFECNFYRDILKFLRGYTGISCLERGRKVDKQCFFHTSFLFSLGRF